MEAVVQKWGNSLGIRIPRNLALEFHLKNGTPVDITEEDDRIVIRPRIAKKLKDMLDAIDDKNTHEEIKVSGKAGKEIW
jgi:antitoxin MazE